MANIRTQNISIENGIYYSTKNNSLAESLMVEDLSEVNIDKDDNLMLEMISDGDDIKTEVEKPKDKEDQKYQCDVWLKGNIPCKYESNSPTDMLVHIRAVHIDKNIEDTGDIMREKQKNEVKEDENKNERENKITEQEVVVEVQEETKEEEIEEGNEQNEEDSKNRNEER